MLLGLLSKWLVLDCACRSLAQRPLHFAYPRPNMDGLMPSRLDEAKPTQSTFVRLKVDPEKAFAVVPTPPDCLLG